jgi:hypothetical protein
MAGMCSSKVPGAEKFKTPAAAVLKIVGDVTRYQDEPATLL